MTFNEESLVYRIAHLGYHKPRNLCHLLCGFLVAFVMLACILISWAAFHVILAVGAEAIFMPQDPIGPAAQEFLPYTLAFDVLAVGIYLARARIAGFGRRFCNLAAYEA